MAIPQLENGYISIACGKIDNDLFNALIKANLNGTEYQVVLTVIRKTYGWHKKEDWISLTQFEQNTGKSRASIKTALKSLGKKSILGKKTSLGKCSSLSLNKDFNSWNVLGQKTRLGQKTVSQLGKKTSHTKETLTKDNKMTPLTGGDDVQTKNRLPLATSLEVQLIDYWAQGWERVYHKKPTITNYGRYIKQAKPYIKTIGLSRMKELCKKYFVSFNPFFKDNKWSLAIFLTDNTINKLN